MSGFVEGAENSFSNNDETPFDKKKKHSLFANGGLNLR